MFFCKQKTAYEMRISDWSSDVCSSDLTRRPAHEGSRLTHRRDPRGGATSPTPHRTPEPSSQTSIQLPTPAQGWASQCASVRPSPEGCSKIGRASCRESVCQYV